MGPHEPRCHDPRAAPRASTVEGCWVWSETMSLATNPLLGGYSRERLAGGISPGYSSDSIGRARIC